MGRINLRDYQLDAIKQMKTDASCAAASEAVNPALPLHTTTICKVAIFSHRMKLP